MLPIIFGGSAMVFGIIVLGGFLRRCGMLTEHADNSLLRLVINILLPCYIFEKAYMNEALREPMNLIFPPLVGFSTIIIGLAVGLMLVRLPRKLTGR